MFYVGLVLLILYVLSTWHADRLHRFDGKINVIKTLSFINGFLLSALILKFLQRSYSGEDTYVSLLIIGLTFTLYYSLSTDASDDKKANKKLGDLRNIYLYIHSIVVGVLFAKMAQSFTFEEMILLGVPILLLKTGATYYKSNNKARAGVRKKDYIVDSIILIMYVVSFQFLIPDNVFMWGLSFVTGTLFFVIINMIVSNKNICMRSVMGGTLLYSILYLLPSIL